MSKRSCLSFCKCLTLILLLDFHIHMFLQVLHVTPQRGTRAVASALLSSAESAANTLNAELYFDFSQTVGYKQTVQNGPRGQAHIWSNLCIFFIWHYHTTTIFSAGRIIKQQ